VTRVQDLARALATAVLGGLLGAACAVAAYQLAPDLLMKMDTDPPSIVRGLYPVERGPDGVSYAWSKDVVTIALPGLDRQHPWQFRLRYRGGRENPSTLPFVQTSVDGVALDMRQAANQFQDVVVALPVGDGSQRGARITIRCSNTFVPGPGDTRQLGILIDEMRVMRLSDGFPFVPRPALAAAALGGAIFGAFFGLIGLTAGGATIAAAALALGQGIAVVHGAGPYAPAYTSLVPWIAGWLAVMAALLVSIAQRVMGQRLRNTARFALAFTVGALYLQLLVLLHPTMPVGDALFQAHRFEWVRDGRYFFTSIAPGGAAFPYAIGLYLVALPFSSFVQGTLGFMVLLRFVVAIADAAAGLLLYPVITRQTGDRLAGAIAVALFQLLPINFTVQMNGKLTNAFAESLLVACIAAIILSWSSAANLRSARGYAKLALLLIAATLTMVSHTGTAAVLVVMMVITGVTWWRFGTPEDAQAGRTLLAVGVVATIAAFALYFGHFAGSYASQLQRVRVSVTENGGGLFDPNAAYGWPAIALASVGAFTFTRRRDRLTLTTWAWLATAGVFLLLGVMTGLPVRADLVAFPAIALLGACGATFLWRVGPFAQSAAIVLLFASVIWGVHNWIAPLR
jgi:hypothetical protein